MKKTDQILTSGINDFDTIGLNDAETQPSIRGGRQANEIRNTYADYFMSPEGCVSWQQAYI